MTMALIITVLYLILIWLVFFKFKWLRFNIVWGITSFWIGVHLVLIFVIFMRFYMPYTIDAHIIRNTIQIVPRLQGPTLLTEVLVEANEPVKKGQPLYRFDRTVYEAKVAEQEAALAAAQQNVKILQTDVEAAQEALERAKSKLAYSQIQQKRFEDLTRQGGARQEELDRWNEQVTGDTASVKEAEANLEKAQLARDSEINGVNTSVAQAQAALDEANYYLRQTTIYAPQDGFIVNQQAWPGLVVGDFRIGAIASLITYDDPYLLASYFQEHLKFVRPGMPVEIALDLHPGQIFKGTVKHIWWATGQGQYLPSGRIPNFRFPKLQGRFAVEVHFDDPKQYRFPAGGHGAVAIYTGGAKGFEFLRRINIRIYSWANFLFPLDFL